ncbi:MAG: hypothetical protein V4629_02965 [Pseudomonadota bacterium]
MPYAIEMAALEEEKKLKTEEFFETILECARILDQMDDGEARYVIPRNLKFISVI